MLCWVIINTRHLQGHAQDGPFLIQLWEDELLVWKEILCFKPSSNSLINGTGRQRLSSTVPLHSQTQWKLLHAAIIAIFQGYCQNWVFIWQCLFFFFLSAFLPFIDIYINSGIWQILSNWDISKNKILVTSFRSSCTGKKTIQQATCNYLKADPVG